MNEQYFAYLFSTHGADAVYEAFETEQLEVAECSICRTTTPRCEDTHTCLICGS